MDASPAMEDASHAMEDASHASRWIARLSLVVGFQHVCIGRWLGELFLTVLF